MIVFGLGLGLGYSIITTIEVYIHTIISGLGSGSKLGLRVGSELGLRVGSGLG